MTGADLNALFLDYDRGVLSGIEPGDSWPEARKKLHSSWKLESQQLSLVRYGDNLYDIDENRCFLEVQLENDRVVALEAGIFGQDKDLTVLTEFYADLERHIASLSPEGNEGWYSLELDGKSYQIHSNFSRSGLEPYISIRIFPR